MPVVIVLYREYSQYREQLFVDGFVFLDCLIEGDIYDVVVNEAGEEVEVNFGRYFLYDRYSRRCVAIDDRIFRLLEGEEITP